MLAGNVSLRPGVPVNVQLRTSRTEIFGPGSFLNVDTPVDDIYYTLSSDVPLLPIHVHIFADSDGRNDYQSIEFDLDGTDALTKSEFLQRRFDLRQVVADPSVTDDSGGVFSVTNTTELRIGRNATLPASTADRAFGRCGVATRLVSVNVIKQSAGIEETIPDLSHQTGCSQLFSQTGGNYVYPLGQYIDEIVASAGGLHVFVTGCPRAPSGACTTAGYGCDSKRIAIVNDLFDGPDVWRTVHHEIGHALGLDEPSTQRFEDTFFNAPQELYPDPANSQDALNCQHLRVAAQTVQDAYFFP